MSAIYIQDLGICNALGLDKSSVSGHLFQDSPTPTIKNKELISKKSTPFYCVAEETGAVGEALGARYQSRNNFLNLLALKQIESSVRLHIESYGASRIAVVIGTSTSGIGEYEAHRSSKGDVLEGYYYSVQETGNCSEFVSKYFGLLGLSYTVSTACSSSAKAMIEGARLIESGLADAVIVGGCDSESSLTLNGFDSLGAISYKNTNPFSANRSGINIGEGAALFLISKKPSVVRFMGGGESSDAYHISSPDPTFAGPKRALMQALSQADLQEKDISYLNLHGTGTLKNDEMESRLVADVFGLDLAVSSTKPLIGHSLGAAGAQELGFCYLSLLDSQKKLPVHQWDGEQDPALPPINFVDSTSSSGGKFYMSNSFAFGGSNVSVILGEG